MNGLFSHPVIEHIRQNSQTDQRMLIAIAGPPAAGKSTISGAILEEYGDEAVVLPMDGFHLDNKVLEAKGLLARKGSPESFDAHGFINMIERVVAGETVYVPEFDRHIDASLASKIEISTQRLVIVEGNYLLFNEEPWRGLLPHWDLSIWLETSLETVEARCVQRWLDHGLDEQAARKRALENDVANARRVIERRIAPEQNFISIAEG